MMARRAWISAAGCLVLGLLAWLLRDAASDAGSGAPRGAPASAVSSELVPLAFAAHDEPAVLAPANGAAHAALLPPAAALAPASESISFGGRVLGTDGAPLAGAVVLLVPDGRTLGARERPVVRGSRIHSALPEDSVVAFTGADGRFTLTGEIVRRKPGEPSDAGLPTQPVLVARADGFADFAHACFDLPCGPYDAGDLQLVPGATVEGRVVDERGWPVAGARVAADADSQHEPQCPIDVASWLHAAVADDDGRFVLPGLPAGSISLQLSAAGRAPLELEPFKVSAGAVTDRGEILLAAGGLLAGTVVDPQGAPVPGARVTAVSVMLGARGQPNEIEQVLAQLRDSGESAVVTSDAEGRFELGGLIGGNVSLLAARDGFEPALVHELAPGRRDVVLPLDALAVLDVLVVDRASRTPLAGTLEARRPMATWTGTVEIPGLATWPLPDQRGVWRVEGAGATGTEISFAAPGYARTVQRSPAVAPGAHQLWSLEVERGVDLHGVVRDGNGRPLVDAGLTLLRKPRKQAQPTGDRVRSDENGHFTFRNVAAGTYIVRGDACGCVQDDSDDIHVVPGEVPDELALVLQPSGAIEGWLLGADGRPLGGGTVQAQTPSPEGPPIKRTARSDTSGRFALRDLLPGTWELSAEPGAQAQAIVEPGGVAQVQLRTARPGMLHGSVLAFGQGVPGTEVRATSERLMRRTVTDERGRYELALESGEWHLRATAADGGWVEAGAAVAAGEQRTVDLILPEGRLDVVVLSTDGTPVAGTALDLEWVSSGVESPENVAWESVPCQMATDAQGHAAFGHLPEANYRVRAHGDAWLDNDPVAVRVAREPVPLEIILQPAAQLHGRVVTASGLPVPDHTAVLIFRAAARPMLETGDTVRGGDGHFSIGRLPSGRYVVAVRADWIRDFDTTTNLAELVVDLVEGTTTELVLSLH
jgi:protocatechuate 3,4-dioxygenase beta subunit